MNASYRSVHAPRILALIWIPIPTIFLTPMFKSIPPITRNLLFINIIVFMVQLVIQQRTNDVLTEIFGLHFFLASDFRIWQLLTYMFLHGSWSHVLLNMFSLWMFGRIIEGTMGQRRFLIYYLITGVGAGLCQELWQFGEYYLSGMHHYTMVNTGMGLLPMDAFLNQWVTIGASGACYGVLLAFGMTFPNERIMLLFPPIPMKAKYFVIVYALIEAYSAFASNGNVAHFAHLGGMFFGWLYFVRCRRQQRAASSFGGWQHYAGSSSGQGSTSGNILQRIRNAFGRWGAGLENALRGWFGANDKGRNERRNMHTHYTNPDHDYNARKREQQARIDAILDKVRRSGYASLTEEEKRLLFDHSNRR